MRKLFIVLLLIIFIVLPVYAADTLHKAELKAISPITSGAILKEYHWQTSNGNVVINVIEIDLNNPNIKVGSILGAGQFTKRLNVSAMAENTGAVAAVNGDFYNTQGEGVPVGTMVIDTRLASSSPILQNIFSFGISIDGKAYIEQFSFSGKVIAPNGVGFQLSGLNKTVYLEEPTGANSHVNKLHLYNDLWGGKTRGDGSFTTPTEMLLKDGKVVEILPGKYFDYAVPEEMYILRGHGDAAKFLTNNFRSGDIIDIQYSIEPDRNWSMMIGGHALLVNDGKAIPYSRNTTSLDGIRARTAVGISKNQKTLYLVGIERKTPISVGLNLTDLSKFIEKIGVWKAMNLDGGGSTTMVSRPLGEWKTEKVFETEQTIERLVVNAIGIYSIAPQGQLNGLLIDGKRLVLINETVKYSIKGFDEYYNPVDLNNISVKWNETDGLGILQQNMFLANKPGRTEITASINSIDIKIPVQVVSKNDIDRMVLTISSNATISGSQRHLDLEMITKSGESRQVPTDLVDWQVYGLIGQVSSEGILTIQNTKNNAFGFVVARYQGFSAPLTLQFKGQQEVFAFNELQGISLETYPLGVLAKISLVNYPGEPLKKVIKLDYDFTKGQGTTAAYIKFEGGGIPVDIAAESIAVSIFGNFGNEWVRAELQDGNGNIHRLDLSSGVNWSSWKTLEVSTKGITKPISLKRIYVVVSDEKKDVRNIQGSILIKGLTFTYSNDAVVLPKQQILELMIGQKTLIADGIETKMDVAPLAIDGRTLVPIRFISEALGSSVQWDKKTGRVTIINKRTWIDLWPGEKQMIVDGKTVYLDVSSQIIQNRTMIPLRAVAESMNLSVQWDPATKKITLK